MGERRTIPLDEVRADGWFEKLAQSTPSFDQLCDIIGERFVAFAVIADVRITAVTVDRARPDASVIEFTVGDSPREHRLPLSELRRRVAAAMLSEEPEEGDLPSDPDVETIQAFLGIVPVLLAPIFGLRLVSLQVGGDEPPTVSVEQGAQREELPVEGLRELVREQVRSELEQVQSTNPLSLDLDAVREAERASEAGDWDRIVQLLGGWPGPLSLLMRTPEGRQLAGDARATIARGLGLLGTAYVHSGRPEWAEEVMRLGIQWSQNDRVAGDLFRRLGEAYVSQEREGEAIGFFRRAISLGAERREVLPPLARCFATRGRYVAAAACADESEAAGVAREELETLRGELAEHLGVAWERFREYIREDGPSTPAAREE